MIEEQQVVLPLKDDKIRAPISPIVHDKVLDLIVQYLDKNSEILDLGAGEGEFSRRLIEKDFKAIPVDGFDIYWRNSQIPLIIANLDGEFASTVGSNGKQFDAIVAIEIIEHLENPYLFLRECAKLLKPNGLLFVTSPNVESITSRIIFLYTGRLIGFGEVETLRPAHITPLFKWKFDLALEEAGFEYVWEGYNRISYRVGDNFHNKIGSLMARLLRPIVKGEKDGENRIVVARRIEKKVESGK
ncbi:MAG: class I SAM-dependent methyltransferase [Acidobacteriota bacterium]|nr:class I SAM-dependent methyltransferase [Acidobacteriota bacterium]